MAFCQNCGSQLSAGARFCTNCGERIAGAAHNPAPPADAAPAPHNPAPQMPPEARLRRPRNMRRQRRRPRRSIRPQRLRRVAAVSLRALLQRSAVCSAAWADSRPRCSRPRRRTLRCSSRLHRQSPIMPLLRRCSRSTKRARSRRAHTALRQAHPRHPRRRSRRCSSPAADGSIASRFSCAVSLLAFSHRFCPR